MFLTNVSNWFAGRLRPKTKQPKARVHLAVESLERRELMAASVLASLNQQTHQLKIEGTEKSDYVRLWQDSSKIHVEAWGVLSSSSSSSGGIYEESYSMGFKEIGSFYASKVNSIKIDALGGGDWISLQGRDNQFVKKNATVDGGAGKDTLIGGLGSDTLIGGADNDTIWATAAQDKISGGTGNDELHVHIKADDLIKYRGRATIDTNEYSQGKGGTDTITVTADLQSFGAQFFNRFLASAKKVTGAFKPVTDKLDQEVPLVSKYLGKTTYGDLLDRFGDGDFSSFVQAVKTINSYDASSWSGALKVGTFQLSSPSNIRVTEAGKFKNLGLGRLTALGFEVPVLQSPTQAFKVLAGQQADLLRWKLPTLQISADARYRFSIPVPGVYVVDLNATLEGLVKLKAGGTLNLDTSGLQAGKLMNGFYVTGAHASLSAGVTLKGGVGKTISVGPYEVGAEAGVGGRLEGTIKLTLADRNGDGRVTLAEIRATGKVFDKTGKITYEFFLYLEEPSFHYNRWGFPDGFTMETYEKTLKKGTL